MGNKAIEGRDILEETQPGLYAQRVQEAVMKAGVVHVDPTCLLIGYPCEDAPRTLHVSFACAEICALCRVLQGLSCSYDRVRWVRAFRGDLRVRERSIEEFALKMGLGEAISKGCHE